MSGSFGFGFSGGGGGGSTPTSSTPKYVYTFLADLPIQTALPVPLLTMTCSDNTVVFLDGAEITSYIRIGNNFYFDYIIYTGSTITFKN